MTDKETYELAGVSKGYYYKAKKKIGFPHSGDTAEKIEFLLTTKDNNRGRKSNKNKGNIVTDKKGLDIAYRRELADLAKVEQQIYDNQLKIIASRDDEFIDVLNECIIGILKDCKECQMTEKQLTFLQDRMSERIEMLSDALKVLRQA